jgi:predicted nucleic acid-binding Zn ribbon protein
MILCLEKKRVSNCTSCGQAIPEGTIKCGNCGTPLKSQSIISASQPQVPMQSTPVFPNSTAESGELLLRLQKAMRRTELLSYAVAGLAVAILAVILLLSLL